MKHHRIFHVGDGDRRLLFYLPGSSETGTVVHPSHHPIMTATLAAIAIENGATVGVLDAAVCGLSDEAAAEMVHSWKANLIFAMPLEYRREMSLERVLSFAKRYKSVGGCADLGAVNFPIGSMEPRRAVEKGELDFALFGDAEPAISALALDVNALPPGTLRRVSGILEENFKTPQVDWADLPTPAWSLFELNSYKPSAHRYSRLPSLPVFASRFCPYGCDFCPQSLFNPSQKHHSRPPKAVTDEIKSLMMNHGIVDIEFYDPTFGIKRDEAMELCQLLEPLDIVWSCYTRCDLLDDDFVSAMAKSGCHTILFGVESGNPTILEKTQKELSHHDVDKAIELCGRHGIKTIASFIIGLPNETRQSILETITMANRLDPTYAQFHLARSFFNRDSWLEVGTIANDWDVTSASVNGRAYIPNGFTSKSLERWLLLAYGSFYLRPSKLLRLGLGLRNGADFKRTIRGGVQVFQHVLSRR